LDIFVARYDRTGSLLWVGRAGGTNYDIGNGIAVDSAGNCYLIGRFEGTASFGSMDLTATGGTNGGYDVFVAKCDGSGNLLWVRQAGGVWNDDGLGIAVDTNGNSYVTGDYAGPAVFGSVTLPSTGPVPTSSIFLAKYDPDGNVLWATYAGGDQANGGAGVALDGLGNIYLIGSYSVTGGNSRMYLAKYDSGANNLWARLTSGGGRSGGAAVAVDPAGNVFVTGGFGGTLSFDGVTMISSLGPLDVFVAKYESTGTLLWVRQLGGTDIDGGNGVATDSSGNCFVSGRFSGTLYLGQTNLVSYGDADGFVAKYDPMGNLVWILQLGGSGFDDATGIAWQAGRGVLVTGAFSGEASFGGARLTSLGSSDVFLARIDEAPMLTVASTVGEAIISWPTNQLGFTLEKATNSLPASQWSAVTNAVSVSGDQFVVTEQLSGSSSFYRLAKP
jgi:hypothetical protein